MGDRKTWYNRGKAHIWHPYTQEKTASEPVKVVATKGCRLVLDNGVELIDGVSSWWTACHGYNHPILEDAVKQQLSSMPHVMFAGVAHEPAYILAERLSSLALMDKVFFTDSGSTAVETALKMAVQYWVNKGKKHKDKFLSFAHGYHGDTLGCMSLCDPKSGMHAVLHDYLPKQFNVPIPVDEYGFNELDALLGDMKDIAGVIIEPLVQGAGGMRFHSADVLAELYRITKKHELLFIADEVMTGFGRTGMMFATHEAAIQPDIMCVGKALTGGVMTLSAVLAKEHVFEAFLDDDLSKALMSGPTYMANPLACAVANASLDLFEQEDRLAQVEVIERQLYEKLQLCRDLPRVKHVRVKGAIGVVELDTDWDEIFAMRQAFLEHNVWIRPFGRIVYIMPPFVISESELTQLTDAVFAVLQQFFKK